MKIVLASNNQGKLKELQAMLTPLGWLERNPTYKEQLREIALLRLTGTFG